MVRNRNRKHRGSRKKKTDETAVPAGGTSSPAASTTSNTRTGVNEAISSILPGAVSPRINQPTDPPDRPRTLSHATACPPSDAESPPPDPELPTTFQLNPPQRFMLKTFLQNLLTKDLQRSVARAELLPATYGAVVGEAIKRDLVCDCNHRAADVSLMAAVMGVELDVECPRPGGDEELADQR